MALTVAMAASCRLCYQRAFQATEASRWVKPMHLSVTFGYGAQVTPGFMGPDALDSAVLAARQPSRLRDFQRTVYEQSAGQVFYVPLTRTAGAWEDQSARPQYLPTPQYQAFAAAGRHVLQMVGRVPGLRVSKAALDPPEAPPSGQRVLDDLYQSVVGFHSNHYAREEQRAAMAAGKAQSLEPYAELNVKVCFGAEHPCALGSFGVRSSTHWHQRCARTVQFPACAQLRSGQVHCHEGQRQDN